jgi:methylglyoxal synthase
MSPRKRLALIAHDNCKADLVDRARFNRAMLAQHELFATGTTGAVLAGELGLSITFVNIVVPISFV